MRRKRRKTNKRQKKGKRKKARQQAEQCKDEETKNAMREESLAYIICSEGREYPEYVVHSCLK